MDNNIELNFIDHTATFDAGRLRLIVQKDVDGADAFKINIKTQPADSDIYVEVENDDRIYEFLEMQGFNAFDHYSLNRDQLRVVLNAFNLIRLGLKNSQTNGCIV
jgi:hypothetical protein